MSYINCLLRGLIQNAIKSIYFCREHFFLLHVMKSVATTQKVQIPNACTQATCLKCKFSVILLFVPRPLKVGKKILILTDHLLHCNYSEIINCKVLFKGQQFCLGMGVGGRWMMYYVLFFSVQNHTGHLMLYGFNNNSEINSYQ